MFSVLEESVLLWDLPWVLGESRICCLMEETLFHMVTKELRLTETLPSGTFPLPIAKRRQCMELSYLLFHALT